MAAFCSVNAALHQQKGHGEDDDVQLALIEELRKEYIDILKLFESKNDGNVALEAFERCEAVLDGELFANSRRSRNGNKPRVTQPAVLELQQAFLTISINLAQTLHLKDSSVLIDLAMEAVEWFPKDPLMWLQLSDSLDQAIHDSELDAQNDNLRFAICKRLALLKAQSMLPLDVTISRDIQQIDQLILHTPNPNIASTIPKILIQCPNSASYILNHLVIVARPIVHDILQQKTTPILDQLLEFDLSTHIPTVSMQIDSPMSNDASRIELSNTDTSSQSKSQREVRSNKRAAREQTERSKTMPLTRIVDRIVEALNQVGEPLDDSEYSQLASESSNIIFEAVSGTSNYDPPITPTIHPRLISTIIDVLELVAHAPSDAIWSLQLSQSIRELVVDVLNPLYLFFTIQLSSHALLLWLEVLSLPTPMADCLDISTHLMAHLRQSLMMDLVEKEQLYIHFIWCQFCIIRQPDLLPLLLQALSIHSTIISQGSNHSNQLRLSISSVLSAARQLEIDQIVSNLFSQSSDGSVDWCALSNYDQVSHPVEWLISNMKHIKTEPLIKLYLSIISTSNSNSSGLPMETSLHHLITLITLRLQQANLKDLPSLLVDSFFFSIPDHLWISLQSQVPVFCNFSAIRTFHMLSVLTRLDLDIDEDLVFHLIRDHILAEKLHIKNATCSIILNNWLVVARKLNSFILQYAALRVIVGTPSLDLSDPWNLIKKLGDDCIPSTVCHQIVTLDHCLSLFSLVYEYIQSNPDQIDLTRQTMFADALVLSIINHLCESSHFQQLQEHCHQLIHLQSTPPSLAITKSIPQYKLQPSLQQNMRIVLDAILWKLELLDQSSSITSKRQINDQTLEQIYLYAAVLDVDHRSDWLWDLGLYYHNELLSRLNLSTNVIINDSAIISLLIVKSLNSFLFCPLQELTKNDRLMLCQMIKSMATGILSIFLTNNSALTRPDAARLIMKLTDSMNWTVDLVSCQLRWYRFIAQKWLGMPLDLLWKRRLNILKCLLELPESVVQQDWIYHVLYKLIKTSTENSHLEILKQTGVLDLAEHDQMLTKSSLFHALGKLDLNGNQFRHFKGIAMHSSEESERSSAWISLMPSIRPVLTAGKKTLSGSQLLMTFTTTTPDFTADYYLHYEKIIIDFATSVVSTEIGQLAISLILKRLVNSDQIIRRKTLCIRLVSLLESVDSEYYDRSLSLITSHKF